MNFLRVSVGEVWGMGKEHSIWILVLLVLNGQGYFLCDGDDNNNQFRANIKVLKIRLRVKGTVG